MRDLGAVNSERELGLCGCWGLKKKAVERTVRRQHGRFGDSSCRRKERLLRHRTGRALGAQPAVGDGCSGGSRYGGDFQVSEAGPGSSGDGETRTRSIPAQGSLSESSNITTPTHQPCDLGQAAVHVQASVSTCVNGDIDSTHL